jgi:hypothetical protein
MFIPDPDFYLSQIPDPGSKKSATKERGEKNFVVVPFFVVTKRHRIRNTGISIGLALGIRIRMGNVSRMWTEVVRSRS